MQKGSKNMHISELMPFKKRVFFEIEHVYYLVNFKIQHSLLQADW